MTPYEVAAELEQGGGVGDDLLFSGRRVGKRERPALVRDFGIEVILVE